MKIKFDKYLRLIVRPSPQAKHEMKMFQQRFSCQCIEQNVKICFPRKLIMSECMHVVVFATHDLCRAVQTTCCSSIYFRERLEYNEAYPDRINFNLHTMPGTAKHRSDIETT